MFDEEALKRIAERERANEARAASQTEREAKFVTPS